MAYKVTHILQKTKTGYVLIHKVDGTLEHVLAGQANLTQQFVDLAKDFTTHVIESEINFTDLDKKIKDNSTLSTKIDEYFKTINGKLDKTGGTLTGTVNYNLPANEFNQVFTISDFDVTGNEVPETPETPGGDDTGNEGGNEGDITEGGENTGEESGDVVAQSDIDPLSNDLKIINLWRMQDKNGKPLGIIQNVKSPEGDMQLRISTIGYKEDGTDVWSRLLVGIDKNGTPYAKIDSPIPLDSNSLQLATTEWVRSLCILNNKPIEVTENITVKKSLDTVGDLDETSELKQNPFYFLVDKDEIRDWGVTGLAKVLNKEDSSLKELRLYLNVVRASGTGSGLGACYLAVNADNESYLVIPEPTGDSNNNTAATTKWVREYVSSVMTGSTDTPTIEEEVTTLSLNDEGYIVESVRPLTTDELMDQLKVERDIRLAAYDSAIKRLQRQGRLAETTEEKNKIHGYIKEWDLYAEALCNLPDQDGSPWDGGGVETPWPTMPNV